MLSFRFKNSLPPGGKRFYLIPETQVYFETYGSWLDLTRQVERYYAINGFALPPNLQALMENYMCLQLPSGFCAGEDPRVSPAEKPITFYEAVEATERFYRGKRRGLVAVKVADDRATRCVRCPQNARGMCTNCNGLRALASRFVGGRKLKQDPLLGVCRIFRLPVNGLVHTQDLGSLPEGLPDSCWAGVKT